MTALHSQDWHPAVPGAITVKICGLSEAVGLSAALAAGADLVGFVFFEPSPRHVPLGRARALRQQVEGRARVVALTVDADDTALAAVVDALAPDLLQLHGAETPERVAAVRARFGLPVMRGLGVTTATDLERVTTFEDVADALLLDAGMPPGASRPGGNGTAFDWTLLRGRIPRKPWLLAGGLDADNVGRALRETGARGVDVSSGVERAPGVKDAGRIARFVAQARHAGERLGSLEAIG